MNAEEYKVHYTLENKNWWFVAKRNQLKKIFSKLTRQSKVLDIGCGTGAIMEQMRKQAGKHNVHGLDYEQSALDFCKKRGLHNLKQGDAHKLPYQENSFDMITMFDVLEHLQDDKKVVQQLRKVLKKEGKLVLTVPAFQFLWTDHDISLHHYRRYTKEHLKRVLEEQGFKVEKMQYLYNSMFFVVGGIKLMNAFLPIHYTLSTSSLETNKILNALLLAWCNLEQCIARVIKFPFGTSVYCVAKASK
jgi:ubiquinone/menaquinone biosynthesis C-methylase UbiE